jgi:hypothetical protein
LNRHYLNGSVSASPELRARSSNPDGDATVLTILVFMGGKNVGRMIQTTG